MTLEVKPWNELSRKEINDIFSLRSEVFIVEQECAYQDVDGKDKQADHVMLHVDNELVGYTRVFPENTYFKEASFGRAVVKKNHRGEGYGHLLVDKSLEHLKAKKQSPIKISAQSYLKEFYSSHGFIVKGDEYMEDGIPHTAMYLDLWEKNIVKFVKTRFLQCLESNINQIKNGFLFVSSAWFLLKQTTHSINMGGPGKNRKTTQNFQNHNQNNKQLHIYFF